MRAPVPVTPEQLATFSHEFRTPLNGVLGMARLLEGTPLSAEQKAYVAALRESGDHLLSMVNELLGFARLGVGAVALHPAPMSVETLLRQVCELMSPRAHEKGVEIAWAAEDLPQITADEGRLRQVLLNFTGNAIKFTKAGGVLVRARLVAEGRLRLEVEDTGPGVPPADRERIFEAFVQSDPTHHSQLGGAGLGLAVVARLAQAMCARVGVDAAPDGGALFWFEAAFPMDAPASSAAPLSGLAVAVASPNPIVRRAATLQIEASGGRALPAARLEEALASAPREAVLLLDRSLGVGGRPLRPPAGRRAIVLVAPEERSRIARYRALGFRGYLIKPLRRASVVERVLAALGDTAAQETAGLEDERIAPAAAPGARVLLAEDNPINALLATSLLKREGAAVDRAASGEEALAALASGAYDLILMDLRMPGLNGVETARALRAKGLTTPIVALTADAFEDDRRACLEAGMDDFLAKPLTPDALRAALARWVGGRWTPAPSQAKLAS